MTAIMASGAKTGMTDLPVIDHRPLPKYKGEAPKCKTCKYFYSCTKSHGTMSPACEIYVRKKKRR